MLKKIAWDLYVFSTGVGKNVYEVMAYQGEELLFVCAQIPERSPKWLLNPHVKSRER